MTVPTTGRSLKFARVRGDPFEAAAHPQVADVNLRNQLPGGAKEL